MSKYVRRCLKNGSVRELQEEERTVYNRTRRDMTENTEIWGGRNGKTECGNCG